jgi:hypothetical protein
MKLSENTIDILRNFSLINSSILLKPGNFLKTVSPTTTILAQIEVAEDFPVTFGIYDLQRFLENLRNMENPTLTFGKDGKYVEIEDSLMRIKYYACSPSTIIAPPDKKLELKRRDVEFSLSSNILGKITKFSHINDLRHISIVGKDNKLFIVAHDRGNDTSNSIEVYLKDWSDDSFIATFKRENLISLLTADYDVAIMIDGFAQFINKNKKLKYDIALEDMK